MANLIKDVVKSCLLDTMLNLINLDLIDFSQVRWINQYSFNLKDPHSIQLNWVQIDLSLANTKLNLTKSKP